MGSVNEDHVYTLCDGDQKQLKIDKCSRFLILLVCISLLLSVITLAVYLHNQKDDASTTIPWCMPRSSVEPAGKFVPEDTRLYNSLRKDEDKDECCADNSEQSSAMVKLLSRKMSHRTSAQRTSAPRTSAKVMSSGAPMNTPQDLNSIAFAQKSLFFKGGHTRTNVPRLVKTQMYINPNQSDPIHELTKGVLTVPSGIKIIHPGLYFVFKSINFLPDSSRPCGKFSRQIFTSYLLNNHAGQRTILSRTEHTCCPDCTFISETGFGGGIYKLEKDDIIEVEVSGRILRISRDVTFVGLVMMGGQGT